MDGILIQPDSHRSAINKNLHKSYKINSTLCVIKTLAALLAFLTNLADWTKPHRIPFQPEQPQIVTFLEQVVCQLVYMKGRDW